MQIKKPYLLIEINENNIKFLVVEFKENLEFDVCDSFIVDSAGITGGRITNILDLSQIIKKQLNLIEKKIGYIFKTTTVVYDYRDVKCINISGFKKLSGSKIMSEDISFILNDVKKTILENEINYSLIHLFNTNFVLDKVSIKNLPIGLHGDFYNQHLTFFLLPKNEIKNLNIVLNNCHIESERIISKSFVRGIDLLKKEQADKTIILVNIGQKMSNISIYKNLSFLYCENFTFGTDIIIKDISKVCSLNFELAKDLFNKLNFFNSAKDDYIPENYFKDVTYRKISNQLVEKIILARSEEIIDIIYNKNINLSHLIRKDSIVNVAFEVENYNKNLKNYFRNLFYLKEIIFANQDIQVSQFKDCLAAASLIGKGWEKEAIPIIQTKKSIISRIFEKLFLN
ncbi:hypothetical protein OAS47_01220 [Pelagibacteraceae bacterium]|nr:hypothetical protein [Pelagibacteraceae bacterium]